MSMAALVTALTIGSTIAGGVSAFASAAQAREEAKAQEEAQRRAYLENAKRINEQMTVERAKSVNRANLIRSRIRVATGEAGIGYGGTYEALMRQTDYDDFINREIIGRNAQLAISSEASKIQAVPETINPLISGFLGSLGGLQTGLSIGGSLNKLFPKE